MGRVISIDKEVSFGKKEWDLLSFFLQNARTLCVRLAEGMGKKDGLQEYAKLLQSLWSSLDHAWAVAKSYADKGSADWEEARKLVVGIEHFVWVSGKVLSGVERSELVSEVAKLKEDLKDAEVEGAKLHQVVLGAEGQWKKVLDLVANNLGPYKMELGAHIKP